MRNIDVHAHYIPASVVGAETRGEDWYGLVYSEGPSPGFDDPNGRRVVINSPKLRFTPTERLADMDASGTDVQVVSIHTPFFGYSWDSVQTLEMAREVNDAIAELAHQHPQRFVGMATLPAQDVAASIGELERAVNVLGLKGAELDAVVNGENWDEPRFLPLFKAAEELGALLFFHPQPQANIVALERSRKYSLPNSVGVPLEDAMVVATLIFGGILEECPNLKACIAHGGGPACFGMGRTAGGSALKPGAISPGRRVPGTTISSPVAEVPHRCGGRRPCGDGERLAFRRMGPVSGRLVGWPATAFPRRHASIGHGCWRFRPGSDGCTGLCHGPWITAGGSALKPGAISPGRRVNLCQSKSRVLRFPHQFSRTRIEVPPSCGGRRPCGDGERLALATTFEHYREPGGPG